MPAKGSCCCDIIRAGTMWKINVHTGETVVSLDYSHASAHQPIATMCGTDDNFAVEFGSNSLFGANTRLWTKSGGAVWGPLSTRNEQIFRGWAHFIDDYDEYIVYGGQGIGGEALEVLDRSNGDQVAHSMTGWFVKAEADYVDTNGTAIRRYEDDFSTLRASVNLGTFTGLAHPTNASYAKASGLSVKVWEPSDLSERLSFTAPFSISTFGADAEGGVYLFHNATNRLVKYTSSSTPDWDVIDAAYTSPNFGAFNNLYSLEGSPLRLFKFDGDDGSIAWECDFSAYVNGLIFNSVYQNRQTIGHSGVILLPCGSEGLVAIDDEYGSVLWHSENKGYGRPIPDGDDYVWCCGLYGT